MRGTPVACVASCLAWATVACARAGGRTDAAAARVREASAGAHLADTAVRFDATPRDASDAAPTPDAARPRRITITATGDLVLHASIVRVAEQHRDEGRLVYVLGALAPLLSSRTIAFANLETSLTSRFRPPDRGRTGILGAQPEFARDLARVGFDVLQLANNHAYDQTGDGLFETIEALRAAGVTAVGAGPTDDDAYGARILERDGMRIAFLAYAVRTNEGPGRNAHDVRIGRIAEPTRALAAIAAARTAADLVVVGTHWSRDRVATVDDDDRALGRRLVSAGADLVLGTGTGLLQRVERVDSERGQAVLAYSLGSCVSAHGGGYRVGMTSAQVSSNAVLNDPAQRDGVLLHATFDLSTPPTVRVSSLLANAVWVTHADGEIRVIALRGTDERIRQDRLRAVQSALGPAVRVRP